MQNAMPRPVSLPQTNSALCSALLHRARADYARRTVVGDRLTEASTALVASRNGFQEILCASRYVAIQEAAGHEGQ